MKFIPVRPTCHVIQFLILVGISALLRADDLPKVVCFGDSITKRGYNEILGPLVGAETVNAGVGGHNTSQGLRRMEKDVLVHKPEVVVVFFGTNDLRVDSERAHVPLDRYRKNLTEMVKRCRKVGAKVVLCTLPPIKEEKFFTRHKKEDFDAHGGLPKLIAGYRKVAMEVADTQKVALVDLNQLLTAYPKWLSPDGVHPSTKGTTIIARLVAEKVGPLLKKGVAKNDAAEDNER